MPTKGLAWLAAVLGLSAALLAGCASGPAAQATTTTATTGPPRPDPSLGAEYAHVLAEVPYTFLQFSNSVRADRQPDGDTLYRQAAPVISALRTLDAALITGSAPTRIARDIATLVLADQGLLSDLQHLPGLTGNLLSAWERQFSADGSTEQAAYGNVLYDFGLPSVGSNP